MDIHVLDGVGTTNQWNVVMHFDIPNINNFAETSFRVCLVNSGRGGTTVLALGNGTAGTITQVELDAIKTGSVLEFSFNWELERAGTDLVSIQKELRREYARRDAALSNIIVRELKYFGFVIDRQ